LNHRHFHVCTGFLSPAKTRKNRKFGDIHIFSWTTSKNQLVSGGINKCAKNKQKTQNSKSSGGFFVHKGNNIVDFSVYAIERKQKLF
jgi:hypothetical protein